MASSDPSALRARADRADLVERIARALPADGRAEPLPGLHLFRASAPTEPLHTVLEPSLCVIAQGAKEVRLGDRPFRYDAYHYLLVTADLPLSAQVVEATPERPYLTVRLALDPALVRSVLAEAGGAARPGAADPLALDVSSLGADLLDAVARLVRLADRPAEAAVLAPLVTREVVYRLLRGDQGARLRHVAVRGGDGHRIARAIGRLRREFDRPVRMDDLAGDLGMSASTFYQRFKAVTGLSPLQFQKRVRLQEARRLLLADDLDAATVGFRVGYNDASHFSREYKRLFGEPPMQDAGRLREAAPSEA